MTATEITGAVIAHNIWGPRRKSWGIEMTLITSFMCGAGRHSALVDTTTIRFATSLSGLIPLPSFPPSPFTSSAANSAASSPISTPRRMSRPPQHLQVRLAPEHLRKKERVVHHIHGGAYYLSSAAGQRLILIPLSKYTDTHYRLALETRFPGPLHDAVCAYLRRRRSTCKFRRRIIVCGDSTGGGLSLALLMYLRDNAYPLPASAILVFAVDLTMSCDSKESNAPFDVVPVPTATNHMNPIVLYLGDQVDKYLTHPRAMRRCCVRATRHELYKDAVHILDTYPFLVAARVHVDRRLCAHAEPTRPVHARRARGGGAGAGDWGRGGDGYGLASKAAKEELEQEELTESEPEEEKVQKACKARAPPAEPAPTSALRRIQPAVFVIIPKGISRPTLKRHRSQHYCTSSRDHLPTLAVLHAHVPGALALDSAQRGLANSTLSRRPYSIDDRCAAGTTGTASRVIARSDRGRKRPSAALGCKQERPLVASAARALDLPASGTNDAVVPTLAMLNTAHKYIGTVPIVDAIPANIEGVMRQCLAYEPRSAPRAFEPCSAVPSVRAPDTLPRASETRLRIPVARSSHHSTLPRPARSLAPSVTQIAYSDSSTLMDFIIIIGIHAAIQTFYIPTTGQLVPPPHSGDHGIQCRAYPQLPPLCPFMSRSYLSAHLDRLTNDALEDVKTAHGPQWHVLAMRD
ncbi:hypothetical protein B0H11DRAFT_2238673 [Mycena galericulata]|nr:hypothetical protein B0H11DRAFT_2238673 [Mycena galericulata]